MHRQTSLFALLVLFCMLAGCGSWNTPPASTTSHAPIVQQSPEVPASIAPSIGAEILFLRDGVLVALDPATAVERILADQVSDFAAAPGSDMLALVRNSEDAAEIWLVGRDGTNLRRLTSNNQIEAGLNWSPDGLKLAYTASSLPKPLAPDLIRWSAWCAAGEARMIAVAGEQEMALGVGCEPAFSPDGRHVAFTTPPTAYAAGADILSAANTVSVVDSKGTNSMILAQSNGQGAANGLLVYGPAWSPDSMQVAYQRHLGYQSLIDANLTEIGGASPHQSEPIGFGAGWLLSPAYAPDGKRVVVVNHNYSDARGFEGYEAWQAQVLRLGEQEQLFLPDEPILLQAATEATLARVTAATWISSGTELAVVLPKGWNAQTSDQEALFPDKGPGELWIWRPGTLPEQRLAENLDFGSPILWLPPYIAGEASK